jgi:hypothetical protein
MDVMNNNPYSPPTAVVADIVTQAPTERPRQIKLAIRYLWASVAVGYLYNIYTLFNAIFVSETLNVFKVVTTLIGFAISVPISIWFIGKISAGKNWARNLMIVFSILSCIGLAMYWLPALALPIMPIQKRIGGVQTSLGTVALVLICFGEGRHWFRPKQIERPTGAADQSHVNGRQ